MNNDIFLGAGLPFKVRPARERGFRILEGYQDIAIIPQAQTTDSAGSDIHSIEAGIVPVGRRRLFKTGITAYMQKGEELQIRSRSGLTLKKGIIVLNSPGTVDKDYEGNEIGVILYNAGEEDFEVKIGDRIAQAVFAPYLPTDHPPKDQDRESGFGHTGI